MLYSVNPTDGNTISSYEEMEQTQISNIIETAHQNFLSWRKTDFEYRKQKMKNAASVLIDKKEDFARLMTNEMGKPIAQSKAEVEKCAWVCEFFADNAERFLSDELIKTDADKSYVTYQPLGVVLAVMPWNFPFWQVFRFASPNLMAGNAGILKHSSNVSGCSLAIEKIFLEAGFPEGLFPSILVSSKNMDSVIEDKKIKAVTLTGSVPAGRSVAKKAGEMLKKTVLELGGSDPYVILDDADLEKTADICSTARLLNGGQSCIAAKRFVITQKIYDEFERIFIQKMGEKKMGDPLDESNYLGPQASTQLRNELHQQVEDSVTKGAILLLGGKVPEGVGAFYPPTVLSNVKKGMPAYDAELFGPVAALIKAEDEDDAIRIANDTAFGLGAAVFTNDIAKGEIIAKEKLNAGCCFINDFVKSDPRLPFGGINDSGYGRELSVFGIREFVNIKTVYVK